MIGIILGVVDILAGIMLAAGGLAPLRGNGFLLTLAAVMLLKGGWYVIMGYTAKAGSPGRTRNMIVGIIDLVAAPLIILAFLGMYHPVYFALGFFVLVKGAWQMVDGLRD